MYIRRYMLVILASVETHMLPDTSTQNTIMESAASLAEAPVTGGAGVIRYVAVSLEGISSGTRSISFSEQQNSHLHTYISAKVRNTFSFYYSTMVNCRCSDGKDRNINFYLPVHSCDVGCTYV